MSKKVVWNILGTQYELDAKLTTYAKTGNPALQLFDDGEPFAVVSVNVPDVYGTDNLVAVKDYSENEGVLQALIDAEIVTEPLWYTESGFINIPVCGLLLREEE